AAFDLKKGVISPGGVGYDINCLTGDTKILTEFGNSVKIEDFEKYQSEIEIAQNGHKIKQLVFSRHLPTLNLNTKELENKAINLFMSKDSDNVYEITLESGLKIKATEDHPFLTKEGMKKLSELKEDTELAINTFEGTESQEVVNEKEAILTKIIGYMFGDGAFYETKGKLYAAAYGAKEDLEKIKTDLLRLEIKTSLFSRTRKHLIKTRYGEKNFEAINWELHIYNQTFLKVLKERGLALGNKTRQEIRVPEWIKRSSKTIKRLFLAGFFGAEMSSPQALSKTCFNSSVISQNKITSLKQNCRDFLIDIALLLEEFGIKDYTISERSDYFNKYNEKTSRLRLMISGEDNIIKIWQNIGFEYNNKRQNIANIASLYILLKQKENQKRISMAKRIKEYKSKGLKLKEVQRVLEGQINSRFIERHYYENASQRINLDFIGFNDFKNLKLKELSEFGTIFDKIKEIKKIEGIHKVYDFNIQDNHNFIANCFIVSNCGVRLLTTNISKSDFIKKREQILSELYKNVPSGVGNEGEFKLSEKQINEVLQNGSHWALENGYAT
ncbi:MAG: RtcB family protein, partial [Nanoarchaeota archaeon]